MQGRIQDFKLGGGGGGGGGALEKIMLSGGRREKCWGISTGTWVHQDFFFLSILSIKCASTTYMNPQGLAVIFSHRK